METTFLDLHADSVSVGGIIIAGSPPHADEPTHFTDLRARSLTVGEVHYGSQSGDNPTEAQAVDALFLTIDGEPIEPRDYVYASGQIVFDADKPVVTP